MQRISKYTLNSLDDELNELAKICFDIDRESRAILGILAKYGPLSQTRITSLGKRRTILSRDIIRYRISKTDLSGKDDFLTVKKGKKIGNLKKVEKLYSLTFKGILASLSEVILSENFWIKNYVNILTEISDDITAKEFFHHIYHHIILFLIFHSKQEGMLTKYNNPETDFNDEYSFQGHLISLLFQQRIKGIPVNFKETFIDSLEAFLISVYIVGNLFKKSLRISNTKNNNHKRIVNHEKYVEIFLRQWMWTIFLAVGNKPKKILELHEKNDESDHDVVESEIIIQDSFGEDIVNDFLLIAEEELMKIDPNLHFDSNESLLE